MDGNRDPRIVPASKSDPGELNHRPVRVAEHVRGRALSSAVDLESRIQSELPAWDRGIQIGPFTFPTSDSVNHFCFVGAPGSGKTVLMRILMQSVLPRVGEEWKAKIQRPSATNQPPMNPNFHLDGVSPVSAPQFDLGVTPPPVIRSMSASTPQFVRGPMPGSTIPMAVVSGLGLFVTIFGAVGASSQSSAQALGFLFLGIPFLILGGLAWKSYSNWKRTSVVPAYRPQPVAPPVAVPRKVASPQVYDGPESWEGHRALIYDAKLEALPILAGLNLRVPFVSLNPFDKRSAAWDMAADITEPATAKQIASILIPEEKNATQPFFADASRQLLEGVMTAFMIRQPGKWTFRDVLLALKSGDRLRRVLGSVDYTRDLVEAYLANERESKSILATLATKLGPYDAVAAMWSEATEKASLREWVDGEGILVLGNDESYRSSLDSINRAIFKRAVELLLAKPETVTGRTWFFLDEVREAGNLDGLGRLMTKGRSVGASVVLGFQDIDGLRDAFGEKGANEIVGLCGTKCILRCDSPETAKWAESVFGEYEAVEVKRSVSAGSTRTEGVTETKGTTRTEGRSDSKGSGNNWQKGDLFFATGWQDNKSSSTNESTSESESKATSRSEAESRTDTLASDRVKRGAILASEFMSLSKTSAGSGLRGFVASHYGAAPFFLWGFQKLLSPLDPTVARVDYRDASSQFLKQWSENEASRFMPGDNGKVVKSEAQETSSSRPAVPVLRRFLPESNPERGIIRREQSGER